MPFPGSSAGGKRFSIIAFGTVGLRRNGVSTEAEMPNTLRLKENEMLAAKRKLFERLFPCYQESPVRI